MMYLELFSIARDLMCCCFCCPPSCWAYHGLWQQNASRGCIEQVKPAHDDVGHAWIMFAS